jgi:hypothetical protein
MKRYLAPLGPYFSSAARSPSRRRSPPIAMPTAIRALPRMRRAIDGSRHVSRICISGN